MPSAANGKSEKAASSEAPAPADNSPVRQIMTVIEHKIRNLEKRKSKLTSYRDLQKAGKDLNYDQKIAVAKYDEVAQTLEFARDLSKQVTQIAVAAERDAKKQAKREAWIRYASDTNKIREVLLVLDCLMQMGSSQVRDDFLSGSNGAPKLTEQDLNVLDDLYPEVTPKHELNEEGQPGFHVQLIKAADHLYSIIDGKPKEALGTTYTHIKEIITTVHGCGYFDKVPEVATECEPSPEDSQESTEETPDEVPVYPTPAPLPVPPAAAVVPAPGYPLRPLPPITLQEVEHAYFAQQYPQQRPISEVIGSQNFFFLQESEIDSPVGTPQPPPVMQPSPPHAIPTQTFTNQHFVRVPDGGAMPLPPQHYPPPHHEHPAHGYAAVMPHPLPHGAPLPPPHVVHASTQPPAEPPVPHHQPAAATASPVNVPQPQPDERPAPPTAAEDNNDDEWKDSRGHNERDDAGDRKAGQGDGQARFRRYGRGGRGAPNGYRGARSAFQSRQGGDRQGGDQHGESREREPRDRDYNNRPPKEYSNRQYGDRDRDRDSYRDRRDRERPAKDGPARDRRDDGYYGNGDADAHHGENGRDRYNDYQGGYKGRGRGGGPRAAPRSGPRPPRSTTYTRKTDNNAPAPTPNAAAAE